MTTRRWRRPSVFAVVLTVVGMAIFMRLGVWQIHRAGEKQRLFAAFANAPHAPLQTLAAVRDITDAQRYPHLQVRGHFDAQRGYLLDEQANQRQIGVHAIGVFVADGQAGRLLVDRGWVAWNHAPGTVAKVPALPTGEVELTGIYAPFPGGGLRLGGNALARQTTWPKLTLFLDRSAIAADLGQSVLPRLLLLDPAPGSGFVRAWKPNVLTPQRHWGYAVQWFGFALLALAIFVVLHWRKPDGKQDEYTQ